MKQTQNFKNHTIFLKGFHGLLTLGILGLVGGGLSYLIQGDDEATYPASLFILISLLLTVIMWYLRIFPLKAQDRAIRAEENLRHYVLAGKLLPPNLKISQIVALRFAPDEELLPLIERTLEKNLTQKEIKKEIKNWKPDYYRV
ncbi:MAG: hypothetical protein CBB92_02015 [Flammeovirgaceae bacterium TMED32]|nr:MAG: hypothetical protein CBB92_02015 [Flammeovirgaceae bacterium TMED32]|tara:strand:+ start:349 stop:780 length:432 start_codon:yes stop_codon:yes gene_type:complete